MTGLDRIREHMTAFLTARGVQAVAAWPGQGRRRLSGPVAAVSIRACEGGPSGFRDYLGERYDRDSGQWLELYGRKVQVTFGLDLYAPRESGAAGCQTLFDNLAEALAAGGPEGLKLHTLSRGETAFDRETGLFHCPAEAQCGAWLYAVADEGGTFLDFEVRGERA